MEKWLWTDREFNFDFPASKAPDLLERLRGTPGRVEEMLSGLSSETLTYRDGLGWSIQENIGHISDPDHLALERIEQILNDEPELVAADMTNRATNEVDLNSADAAALLSAFRSGRGKLVDRFETLDESDWARASFHPRLAQPMRIVDIAYFNAEHDDYHLARIRQLMRSAPRRPG
ncbi:MAG: DinB family protein [Pirellulaceae bacterium]|nr:DinB family protein [Pirellulaceae bacterium]